MYFKTDKYEGNMVEEYGLRWAKTEQGKIPAFIMFEYLQGVLPESMLARVFNQSNIMFNDLERWLRREANRYNYDLGDIESNSKTNHIHIYNNLLDMVGRDNRGCEKIRTYEVVNLTSYKAIGLTEGAKKIVIKTKSHKDNWIWETGKIFAYKDFKLIEEVREIKLVDFLYKYFNDIPYRDGHIMEVVF